MTMSFAPNNKGLVLDFLRERRKQAKRKGFSEGTGRPSPKPLLGMTITTTPCSFEAESQLSLPATDRNERKQLFARIGHDRKPSIPAAPPFEQRIPKPWRDETCIDDTNRRPCTIGKKESKKETISLRSFLNSGS